MDHLEAVKDKYQNKTYEFWMTHIDGDPIVENGPEGSDFDIEVSPTWQDQPKGAILVLISASSHRMYKPLMRTLSFVVLPDEGND